MTSLRLLSVIALSALTLPGCGGGGSPRDVVFGSTPAEALVRTRGAPVLTRASDLRPGSTVQWFRDSSSCQSEGGAVVACAREPRGAETALQYWRHLLKEERTEYLAIPESRDPHGNPQRQLVAPARGVTVVYDRALGRVVRVTEYGPVSR